MAFESWDWKKLEGNVFSLISSDWMLITAGKPGAWNTMTASWGGFGHLWNRDVAFVFVRPTRHTHAFMEGSPGFSLSFFDPDRRKALEVCGSVSGRDKDKAQAAGITPRPFAWDGQGWVSFEEARLVLCCRKLHAQDLDPAGFIDPSIADNYKAKDWHRLYVGAIEAAWKRD
jgi:flavin reductase (DIM6/NTAB) family NADH-FMN oxidoreductase RutF